MTNSNTRQATITGILHPREEWSGKPLRSKPDRNGNTQMEVSIFVQGHKFPTTIRTRDEGLMAQFEQAAARLAEGGGQDLELTLLIREELKEDGGRTFTFRDAISIEGIASVIPGPVTAQPVTDNHGAAQQPIQARYASSKEDLFAFENCMRHATLAFNNWTQINKGYEPSTFSNYIKDIVLSAKWIFGVYKAGEFTLTPHEVQRTAPFKGTDGSVGGEDPGDAFFDTPPTDTKPSDGAEEISQW